MATIQAVVLHKKGKGFILFSPASVEDIHFFRVGKPPNDVAFEVGTWYEITGRITFFIKQTMKFFGSHIDIGIKTALYGDFPAFK